MDEGVIGRANDIVSYFNLNSMESSHLCEPRILVSWEKEREIANRCDFVTERRRGECSFEEQPHSTLCHIFGVIVPYQDPPYLGQAAPLLLESVDHDSWPRE